MAGKVKHDGQSYYCGQCGQAGFRSEMAARGHMSACRGRVAILNEISSLTDRFRGAPIDASEAAPGGALAPPPPAAYGVFGAGEVPGGTPNAVPFTEYLRMRNEAERLRTQLARVEGERDRAVQLAGNHAMHIGGLGGPSSSPVASLFQIPEVQLLVGALLLYAMFQAFGDGNAAKVGSKVLDKAGGHLLDHIFG